MKPLTYLSLLLGISTTTALAALRLDATPDEVAMAEAECGSLGVMRIDPVELPEGLRWPTSASAPTIRLAWGVSGSGSWCFRQVPSVPADLGIFRGQPRSWVEAL
ncbi:hypothetical protein N7522_006317 [Penicillium canescens]|uniref:Uncharacterized protein n=1 Tax=Penicillium canescens TaxID=5083 RepID=A0AAD6IB24_PENCN|nr:uncharacterized protein N7446_010762 [Penicillium canescens]KAJ6003625.1 hypothetical protein N7522_006317 [Penicillium canescens]KAJ6041348.1 hypothetical protein N7460_006738 [Penicillium canescens]KAJ6050653.1 hypothetical protein N7446_010762 [Penicillium canescens]KAJ6065875.1 hypothetical protein N7444_001528 [Penicillium canescens]